MGRPPHQRGRLRASIAEHVADRRLAIPSRTDATGAIADLGVMVPLAAALILTNGLNPSGVFVAAGLLVIASGLYFNIPFPVQPLKALTAVAVAQQLSPDVIHAAGLEIAAVLLVLSIGGIADVVARVFTTTIVRALQFGVGALLLLTAYRLVAEPPAVFRGTPGSPLPIVLAAGVFALMWWAARGRRYEVVFVLLTLGAGIAWVTASPGLHPPALLLPRLSIPDASHFGTAFLLLVLPQIPLTFGNAVVAVSDVAKREFGDRATRVTPSRVCISCGAGNVASAILGGAPMCHGAGGLTAHVRLGARSKWMNVGLGSTFLTLGLFFSSQVLVLLGTLPVWGLAGMLAYAGARHAWLIADRRGTELAVALAAGVAGAYAGNLAVTVGVGLTYEIVTRLVRTTLRSNPPGDLPGRPPPGVRQSV